MGILMNQIPIDLLSYKVNIKCYCYIVSVDIKSVAKEKKRKVLKLCSNMT